MMSNLLPPEFPEFLFYKVQLKLHIVVFSNVSRMIFLFYKVQLKPYTH